MTACCRNKLFILSICLYISFHENLMIIISWWVISSFIKQWWSMRLKIYFISVMHILCTSIMFTFKLVSKLLFIDQHWGQPSHQYDHILGASYRIYTCPLLISCHVWVFVWYSSNLKYVDKLLYLLWSSLWFANVNCQAIHWCIIWLLSLNRRKL